MYIVVKYLVFHPFHGAVGAQEMFVLKIIFSCFTNLGWAQVTPTYNYVRLVGLFSIGNSLGCWSPHLLLLPIVPRVVQFYPT